MAEQPMPVRKPSRPRQKLLLSIDVFERAMVASRREQHGRVVRHFVGLTELLKLLGGLGESSAARCRWNAIGPVRAISIDTEGRLHALVVRPARLTVLNIVVGTKQFAVRAQLPNLLGDLVGRVADGRLAWSSLAHVWAFDGQPGRLGPKTPLFAPPLPNCYADGAVCMGSVDVRRWAGAPADEAFEASFVRTLFNDHGLAQTLTAEASKTYRTVIDAMRRHRGRVPSELLAPIGPAGDVLKGLW